MYQQIKKKIIEYKPTVFPIVYLFLDLLYDKGKQKNIPSFFLTGI